MTCKEKALVSWYSRQLGEWVLQDCSEKDELDSILKCLPKSPCAIEIHLPCTDSRDHSFGVLVNLFSWGKTFKRKVNRMNHSPYCCSWFWGWTESSPWWAVLTAWLLLSYSWVLQFYWSPVACQELCVFDRCLIFHRWWWGFSKNSGILHCDFLISTVYLVKSDPWRLHEEAHRAPLSMELSRQEYWRGLPSPSPFHIRACHKLHTVSFPSADTWKPIRSVVFSGPTGKTTYTMTGTLTVLDASKAGHLSCFLVYGPE